MNNILFFTKFLQKQKDNKTEKKDKVKNALKEGFTNPQLYQQTKLNFTNPTEENPAMNVLLPEINDNPNRKPAAPSFNSAVVKEMDTLTQDMVLNTLSKKPDNNVNSCNADSNPVDNSVDIEEIDDRLFKDLGDNLNFDQSMRSFYPMPNTQIPNDQKAFADFCYGDMISCKEGNALACERNNARYINY